MASPRYTAALVLSALLLASCSGSDNGPTAPEGPSDPALPESHPANVTPILDQGRMTSVRIPVSGWTSREPTFSVRSSSPKDYASLLKSPSASIHLKGRAIRPWALQRTETGPRSTVTP
jgi:hypothetical protein